MNTRQQRRAAGREKAKTESAHTDRVDPALLQLLLSANQKLATARKAAVEAEGVINHVSEQLRETHKMKPGDQIDLRSGLITRAPQAKRKR